ncbi:MAG TPA: sugar phosphate isomerase/epimerase, partial [Armatimonadetes bacterium]|nr:sugar phosphate isomerase/epimerase [Armatimonadota bacterium]
MTRADILQHAREMSYDGIELHAGVEPYPSAQDVAGVRALRERIEGYGLQIAGIQSAVRMGNAISENPMERAAYAQGVREQIDLVKALGGDFVGVWPAGKQPQLCDEVIVERLSDTFSQCAPYAEQQGIIIAMEPEPVQVDYNYEIALAVIDCVGSSYFTVLYDCTHANVISGGDPISVIHMLKGHIGHVHLADNDGDVLDLPGASRSSKHLVFGEGNVDINAVLQALRDVDYNGWIQVDVWENPAPFECSRRNKLIIEQIISEL